MSSSVLHNPLSSTLPSVVVTNQESVRTIIKNPLGPPHRRSSHTSPVSGTSCRRVPSLSRCHLGCSSYHHFCHDALYLARLAVLGTNIYLRPFLSHVATSFGLFLASILPYFNVSQLGTGDCWMVFAYHTSKPEASFKPHKALK